MLARQQLAIGRALVGRPDLLMLDEPSLGLAPKMVGRITDTIREIRTLYLGGDAPDGAAGAARPTSRSRPWPDA